MTIEAKTIIQRGIWLILFKNGLFQYINSHYIFNSGTTDDQLRQLFERFAPVMEADVIKNFG